MQRQPFRLYGIVFIAGVPCAVKKRILGLLTSYLLCIYTHVYKEVAYSNGGLIMCGTLPPLFSVCIYIYIYGAWGGVVLKALRY
jgi:hypothetical protein